MTYFLSNLLLKSFIREICLVFWSVLYCQIWKKEKEKNPYSSRSTHCQVSKPQMTLVLFREFWIIGRPLSEQLYNLCLYIFYKKTSVAALVSSVSQGEMWGKIYPRMPQALQMRFSLFSAPFLWFLPAFVVNTGPLCDKWGSLSDGDRYLVTGTAAAVHLWLKAILIASHFALRALIPWC